MLRGCAVSFPAEPTVYDLLADAPQGLMRVQVKTTTSTHKNGWQVGVEGFGPSHDIPSFIFDIHTSMGNRDAEA